MVLLLLSLLLLVVAVAVGVVAVAAVVGVVVQMPRSFWLAVNASVCKKAFNSCLLLVSLLLVSLLRVPLLAKRALLFICCCH